MNAIYYYHCKYHSCERQFVFPSCTTIPRFSLLREMKNILDGKYGRKSIRNDF